MNKRKLQNENLDRIGRKLLERAKTSDVEIEKIVSSPKLFESVNAKIRAGQIESDNYSTRDRKNVFVWNWQRISMMASVSILVLTAVVGAFVFFGSDFFNKPDNQTFVPQIETEKIMQADFPSAKPTAQQVGNFSHYAEQVDLKTQQTRTRKPVRKSKTVKNPEKVQKEIANKFYALTFAGKPLENGEEFRIVRAELSRSSLFALGVNLSIENESEKVKTDLLIGSDGIARAIRFVK